MSDNRGWEEPTVEGVKRAETHSWLGRRVDMGELVVGKAPSLLVSEPMIREQHRGGFPSRVSIVSSHSTSEGTEAKDPEGGL